MRGNIVKHAHLAKVDGDVFFKQLHEYIDEYQGYGYEVEVQYAHTSTLFSAYITARKRRSFFG